MSKQRHFIALLSSDSTAGIYGYGKSEADALALVADRDPAAFWAAECSRALYEYIRMVEEDGAAMSALDFAHNGAIYDLIIPNDDVIAAAVAQMDGYIASLAGQYVGDISPEEAIKAARGAIGAYCSGLLYAEIENEASRIALIVAVAERFEAAVAQHNADEAREALKGCGEAGRFLKNKTTRETEAILRCMAATSPKFPEWASRVLGEAVAVLGDGAVIGWSGSPKNLGDLVAAYSPDIFTTILSATARARNDKTRGLSVLDLGEFGAYLYDDEIVVFTRDDPEDYKDSPLKLPPGFPVEYVEQAIRAFRTGVRHGEIRGTLAAQQRIQAALGL